MCRTSNKELFVCLVVLAAVAADGVTCRGAVSVMVLTWRPGLLLCYMLHVIFAGLYVAGPLLCCGERWCMLVLASASALVKLQT
jgi:hypothetical protein